MPNLDGFFLSGYIDGFVVGSNLKQAAHHLQSSGPLMKDPLHKIFDRPKPTYPAIYIVSLLSVVTQNVARAQYHALAR